MLRNKKRLAIKLRRAGKSYEEIRSIIPVAKSSLAYWLRNYPLNQKQIEKLTRRYKTRQIENYRKTMRKKRESRLLQTYKEQAKHLLPLSKRELHIAGLFLYLGEGAKQTSSHITVSNTDPGIVKFVFYWYTKVLDIPKTKIKVGLQLYKDMDIKKEMKYWSRLLNIPLSNFWKPYVKNSITQDIDHSGYRHGTCSLYYGSVPLHAKIMMGIKCILDKV